MSYFQYSPTKRRTNIGIYLTGGKIRTHFEKNYDCFRLANFFEHFQYQPSKPCSNN
jgi:hypothetical protein